MVSWGSMEEGCPLILMLENSQRKNKLRGLKNSAYQGTDAAQETARRLGYVKGQRGWMNGGNVDLGAPSSPCCMFCDSPCCPMT